MRKTRTAVIMARFATNCTISSEQIVIKTEVIQVEEAGFTERFYLRNNEGHLKGFQTNLKHFL